MPLNAGNTQRQGVCHGGLLADYGNWSKELLTRTKRNSMFARTDGIFKTQASI